jgi:hypothetical protein
MKAHFLMSFFLQRTPLSFYNRTFFAAQLGGTSGIADSTHIEITFDQNVTELALGNCRW